MQLQIQLIEMSNEQQFRETEREGEGERDWVWKKVWQMFRSCANTLKTTKPQNRFINLCECVFVCQRVCVCVGFSCSLELRSTTMQQLQLGRKLEMAT